MKDIAELFEEIGRRIGTIEVLAVRIPPLEVAAIRCLCEEGAERTRGVAGLGHDQLAERYGPGSVLPTHVSASGEVQRVARPEQLITIPEPRD